MAQKKLALGKALGLIEVVVTTIMAAGREHGEEVIFSVPENKVRELTEQFANSLIQVGRSVQKTVVFRHNKFVAADHFKIDTSTEAVVSIGYMNEVFGQVMLGKVETNIPPAELGPAKEITTLEYLWNLLTKQGHGNTGTLFVNGMSNIFHILGTDGQVWAVGARWRAEDGYWSVYAKSVTDDLNRRDEVFHRNH